MPVLALKPQKVEGRKNTLTHVTMFWSAKADSLKLRLRWALTRTAGGS
jgi:hypothetical protein